MELSSYLISHSLYKLNKGVKASCTIATAKYSGIRGNDLKVTVTTNIDENAKFDV
ncbi:phage tail sheath N-terminal beta-sandwich domain-containing protein, partial [Clostridioides difficile]|uniref:phage tail sheath N-terminal beta-sandwich domain-containing protein n=1 Tax=Clostridioides difficile TaxID=1496 RepID=UPI002FE65CC2